MSLESILATSMAPPADGNLETILDPTLRRSLREGITDDFIKSHLPQLKRLLAFYRAYPDIFIDDLTGYSTWNAETDGEWKGFKFYYYQRITLRVLMRHKKTYIVFSRGSI